MDFCDFKDVVAFGNNQLWRPLAAKVKGHHSGLSEKMVSLAKVLGKDHRMMQNILIDLDPVAK